MDCGDLVKKQKVDSEEPLRMPPVVYQLDRKLWKQVNPWPLMPFEIANKYGWYVSVISSYTKDLVYIGTDDYLVMPVFDKGKPVFYSARRLTDNGGPKYKKPWHQDQKLLWYSGAYKNRLLVGEGIADAAFLSQIAPSAALMGSHADLPEVEIITVLDGDGPGIEAAFGLVQGQRHKGFIKSKAVVLPPGKDPTDIPVAALARIIQEQTGVKL